MYRFAIFFALTLTLSIVSTASAQAQSASEVFGQADADILRGDAYYYGGDYYRAISVYRDFLWAYPADPRAHRVRLKMAWIYYVAGDHRESARQLNRLAEAPSDEVEGWWAQLYLGQVALTAERAPLASRAFESVIDICQPRLAGVEEGAGNREASACLELTGRARLALAEVHTLRHDFDTAIGHLELLPPESPWADDAAAIAEMHRNAIIPRPKSPALAGTLSFIPGLGHFYLGEYANGLLAMTWNGIFIYALVDSILSQRYGQAALIGLLESIWYGGTIFGAIAGAHRHNRDIQREVETRLRRNIATVAEEQPWPARFPVHSPGYLELRLDF